MIKLYFDMDGTLADFYGIAGWLDCLNNEHTKPYRLARTLIHGTTLTNRINALQRKGIQASIITWTAMNRSQEYHEKVKTAKLNWLKKHYPRICWDDIQVTEYGVPKEETAGKGKKQDIFILFDDNKSVRDAWQARPHHIAFSEKDIISTLDMINAMAGQGA